MTSPGEGLQTTVPAHVGGFTGENKAKNQKRESGLRLPCGKTRAGGKRRRAPSNAKQTDSDQS
jgi:hypothetical protein